MDAKDEVRTDKSARRFPRVTISSDGSFCSDKDGIACCGQKKANFWTKTPILSTVPQQQLSHGAQNIHHPDTRPSRRLQAQPLRHLHQLQNQTPTATTPSQSAQESASPSVLLPSESSQHSSSRDVESEREPAPVRRSSLTKADKKGPGHLGAGPLPGTRRVTRAKYTSLNSQHSSLILRSCIG